MTLWAWWFERGTEVDGAQASSVSQQKHHSLIKMVRLDCLQKGCITKGSTTEIIRERNAQASFFALHI